MTIKNLMLNFLNPAPYKTGEPRLLKSGDVAQITKTKTKIIKNLKKAENPDKWLYAKAKQIPDGDYGDVIKPLGVVVHYTVSKSLDGTVDFFLKNGVDIHFVIGKQGEVVQMVPCNHRADHAGISEWRGLKYLNNYFLGIEVVSLGPLKKLNDKFVDGYNQAYKGTPRDKLLLGNRYWDAFTEKQEKSLVDLIKWMLETYKFPVENIVGHYEVAPNRKIDPGGSLSVSMEDFRKIFKLPLS